MKYKIVLHQQKKSGRESRPLSGENYLLRWKLLLGFLQCDSGLGFPHCEFVLGTNSQAFNQFFRDLETGHREYQNWPCEIKRKCFENLSVQFKLGQSLQFFPFPFPFPSPLCLSFPLSPSSS